MPPGEGRRAAKAAAAWNRTSGTSPRALLAPCLHHSGCCIFGRGQAGVVGSHIRAGATESLRRARRRSLRTSSSNLCAFLEPGSSRRSAGLRRARRFGHSAPLGSLQQLRTLLQLPRLPKSECGPRQLGQSGCRELRVSSACK